VTADGSRYQQVPVCGLARLPSRQTGRPVPAKRPVEATCQMHGMAKPRIASNRSDLGSEWLLAFTPREVVRVVGRGPDGPLSRGAGHRAPR
jgi:hypothetical protein